MNKYFLTAASLMGLLALQGGDVKATPTVAEEVAQYKLAIQNYQTLQKALLDGYKFGQERVVEIKSKGLAKHPKIIKGCEITDADYEKVRGAALFWASRYSKLTPIPSELKDLFYKIGKCQAWRNEGIIQERRGFPHHLDSQWECFYLASHLMYTTGGDDRESPELALDKEQGILDRLKSGLEALKTKAAIKIQAGARGMKARKQAKDMRDTLNSLKLD